jgi:Histone deacetylase domain
MILGGQCVNAFCATRPPGHHAGRELHPMKAISNGFCILNTVACAALYATTPLSEHGPGLKRVSQTGMRLTLAPRMDVTPLFILVRANRHSFCSCYFRFASLTLMSTMETELKVRFNSLRKKKKTMTATVRSLTLTRLFLRRYPLPDVRSSLLVRFIARGWCTHQWLRVRRLGPGIQDKCRRQPTKRGWHLSGSMR